MFNNIWELAEGVLAGLLSPEDLSSLNDQLEKNADFANEFNEAVNLLKSLDSDGRQQRFRSVLRDIDMQQSAPVAQKKPRLIQIPANIWRTAAVAAGVALITSFITFSVFVNSANKSASQYSTISRDLDGIKKMQRRQQEEQKALKDSIHKINTPMQPTLDARFTGTGFALTNDGYFVTSYHVINDGHGDFDSVYILCNDNEYYKAFLVNFDAKADLAILKVEKKNFRFGKGEIPYTIAAGKAALGTSIFTLGYPKDDIVYSEGYISAKDGYNDNAQQYTLQLPAGHGQSGSPMMDANGNVQGILTAISSPTESNTYAVSSKALLDLLHTLPNESSLHLAKGNKLSHLGREAQIEKMEDYTFSVKVYKK